MGHYIDPTVISNKAQSGNKAINPDLIHHHCRFILKPKQKYHVTTQNQIKEHNNILGYNTPARQTKQNDVFIQHKRRQHRIWMQYTTNTNKSRLVLSNTGSTIAPRKTKQNLDSIHHQDK